jgi:hypothetical protein
VVYEETLVNADVALQNSEVAMRRDELLAVLTDAVLPLYAGKSVKQNTLDIVHPVLNSLIELWLESLGWSTQGKLSTLLASSSRDNGTVDFYCQLADGRYLVVEVQFGNGGRRERDFDKIKEFDCAGALAMGFLVYFTQDTASSADSGLANYQAALRCIHKLPKFPLSVIGLTRFGSEEADLQALPDIVFPSLLGGSGDNKSLRTHIAQALIDRKPLNELTFLPEHLDAIHEHALDHAETASTVFSDVLERVLQCRDQVLQARLLAKLAPHIKDCERLIQLAVKTAENALKKPAKPRARPWEPLRTSSLTTEDVGGGTGLPGRGSPLSLEAFALSESDQSLAATLEPLSPLAIAANLGTLGLPGQTGTALRRVHRCEVEAAVVQPRGRAARGVAGIAFKRYHPAYMPALAHAFESARCAV